MVGTVLITIFSVATSTIPNLACTVRPISVLDTYVSARPNVTGISCPFTIHRILHVIQARTLGSYSFPSISPTFTVSYSDLLNTLS